MVGCFSTTGTTRNPLRPAQLRGLPPSVDSGKTNSFWVAVQKAASSNKTDAQTYVESIVALADCHMNSSKVVDRDAAIRALIQSMEKTGVLTLVLGGKNLGKSFLKKAALQRCCSKVVVLSEDMRNKPGASLLNALLQVANRTLKKMTTEEEFKPFIPAMAFEGFGPAAAPMSNYVRDVASMAAEKREKVRFALDEFLEKDSGERREAKSALSAITKWTKQDMLSSVILISSEFVYPFRLQAAGLDLRDIGRVIVIGEVPESDMLKMLKDDWGMDKDLAHLFYKYFGGDIYTTKQALESLIRKKENFDPFAVVVCPGLPSCVKNAAARAHLDNIAKQGFSLVEDAETDEGAKMIAEKKLGGVINKNAITFGLPTIFTGANKKWADDKGGFEFAGNAFKIIGAVNIDDLKKAIKKEKPNKVQCDADEIDVFSQEDAPLSVPATSLLQLRR
eukprot:Skav216152  [mRNA]  locus=scaffold3788:20847:23867:+ [translate_table: standard]